MAATVTTPVNITADALFTPSTQTVSTVTIGVLKIVPATVTGVIHLVLPTPIRRWDGASWAPSYIPRL